MFEYLLTSKERLFVEELQSNTWDKGAYMKLSVLILLDMGKRYDEIEAILGIVRCGSNAYPNRHSISGTVAR